MRNSSALLMAAAMAVVFPVAAQNYPTKPVRIVVVSTPGGSVDTLARAIAPRLASKWNQQVLVDNRPGAGGAIAAELVAKAPPDGYTLMMGTIASLATNVSLYKSLPYDPVKDFAPITLVATQNLVLLVHPSIPSRSVKELVALAKKQPGKLTFASAGNGVGGHLSGELFKLLAQIDILHIPYKGVQPAMMDVVGGQVTMVFASIASGMAQVASKRLFPLAVTGSQRSPAAKDLPTMVEAGIKGYESIDLVRPGRARRHAGRHRQPAQCRSRGRTQKPGPERTPDAGRCGSGGQQPGRIRQIHAERNRQVAQGDQGCRHTAELTFNRRNKKGSLRSPLI